MSSKKQNPTEISVISLNTLGSFNFDTIHGLITSRKIKHRYSKLAEGIRELNADVILLQEVHTYWLLKFLKQEFREYKHVVYQKFVYGPKGGLVIFSKIPFELHQYVDFKKRGTFVNKSFIAHVIRNGVLIAKSTHLPIYILNTHLTPNPDFDWRMENRYCKYILAQLEQIAIIINRLSAKGQGILAGGDFNTAKDSELYKRFIKLTKLVDVFAEHKTPTFHQEYLSKKKKTKRIDYIFISNGNRKLSILSKQNIFKNKIKLEDGTKMYLTDHIGLKAHFQLS